MEENKTKAKIIAVAGKGGVGKTSLCSAIVRELVEAFPGKRILAIDADPAVGLSTALGVHVEHTIDDIRNEVIQTSERGEYRQAIEVLNEARFRIFDTMVECEGFAFLAIGRPEAAGIVTLVRDVQSSKAELPMLVTPSAITADFTRLLLPCHGALGKP